MHDVTIKNGQGVEAASGALAIKTGEFTGRSPMDRFIVKDAATEDKVWWGPINKPFDPADFDRLYDKVISYMNDKELFVRDCFVCADPNYRMGVRVVTRCAMPDCGFCGATMTTLPRGRTH